MDATDVSLSQVTPCSTVTQKLRIGAANQIHRNSATELYIILVID